MSIERDLLIEAMGILADYWDPSVTSMISKNRYLYYKLKEYLEQPEQIEQEPIYIVGKGWQCDEMPEEGLKLYMSPPKREPLSDERLRDISNSINATYDFGNISVWQAFYIARAIEKEHDIGGGE